MSDSAMIALLPTTNYWCHIDKPNYPHLTLCYVGKIDELNPTTFNDISKEVLELARNHKPQLLDVDGIDIFGEGTEENPHVEALKFKSNPDLVAMRNSVERWNASKFPFNPHSTVGPVGSVEGDIPPKVLFDRIIAAWGDRTIGCLFLGH